MGSALDDMAIYWGVQHEATGIVIWGLGLAVLHTPAVSGLSELGTALHTLVMSDWSHFCCQQHFQGASLLAIRVLHHQALELDQGTVQAFHAEWRGILLCSAGEPLLSQLAAPTGSAAS